MAADARDEILDRIEKEYVIFIEKLEGIDNTCFDIRLEDLNKTPKEILVEQIDLMKNCIATRKSFGDGGEEKCSYEELKYIFSLMHINLISWIENLSDDSKIIEEYEDGNCETITEWFDRYLISELKVHNEELSMWKKLYREVEDI